MAKETDCTNVPFSFEVYPPRDPSRAAALYACIDDLAAAGADFISVTFGAGGSTGDRSLEVSQYILESTGTAPLAHLTCVGNTFAGANALIREFLDAGIRHFLALRGDPPLGQADLPLGDLESAAQLVQLIDRVQAERSPYLERPVPGSDAVNIVPRDKVHIAVAAYPNGHPRSTRPGQDLEALLAKEAAGATLAITQLFFDASDYSSFVERARAAGVTIPILPGIMPITSPQRLTRVLELSELDRPEAFAAALDAQQTPEGRREVGIAFAAQLVRDCIAAGAPGIHLYAFNQSKDVLETLHRAGVSTAETQRPTLA